MKSQVRKAGYYSNSEIMARWLAIVCSYVIPACMFFILLGNPIGNSFLVSWATRIQIVITVASGAVAILSCFVNGINEKSSVLLVALIFLTILTLLSEGIGAILSGLIPYLCFFMLPFYIIIFKKLENTKSIKQTIYVWNVIYALLFIILSFTDLAHVYYGEYGIKYLEEITLGYGNPNETGIYLLISFMIMLTAYEENKDSKRLLSYGALILSVILFTMVQATKSRICIILALVVTVCKILKIKAHKSKGIITLCFALPAISLAIAMLVPDLFKDITILQDGVITGRDYLYQAFFKKLNVFSFFLGNFSLYNSNNLHNSYLSVFARFGFLGFIVFIVFLYVSFLEYKDNLGDKKYSTPFVSLLCVIVHGVAEATLLVSGVVYGGFVGLLFLLTKQDSEEEKFLQVKSRAGGLQ